MTVTYTAQVATSKFGCFWKLLARWKGSIYKVVWADFLLFCGLYYILSFVYRFALNPKQRRVFENVASYCDRFNNLIPVAFVLGFYVSIVVSRWWEQFNCIPWPDRSALFVSANIHDMCRDDQRSRLLRRTIMRYLNLSYVFTLSCISTSVKKRFPTMDHITEAGFLLPNEQVVIENIKTPFSKYFVPLVWATSLVTRARKEGRIKDDFAVNTLIAEINEYRGKLGTLFNYDWISVPLVYTQVVTLAVYTFFLSCLIGRQFLQPEDKFQSVPVDMYVPVFTFLQFLFYIGWLKVAETLVNPFGEDDDDFDMNGVIDRNIQVSYLVVDEMHSEHPELIKDQYWDDVDFELPYTKAAEEFKSDLHMGSAVDIVVSPRQAEIVPTLSSIKEIDIDDNFITPTSDEDVRISMVPQRKQHTPASPASMKSSVKSSFAMSVKSGFRHLRKKPNHPKNSLRVLRIRSKSHGTGSQNSVSNSEPHASPSTTARSLNQDSHLEDIFNMSDIDTEEIIYKPMNRSLPPSGEPNGEHTSTWLKHHLKSQHSQDDSLKPGTSQNSLKPGNFEEMKKSTSDGAKIKSVGKSVGNSVQSGIDEVDKEDHTSSGTITDNQGVTASTGALLNGEGENNGEGGGVNGEGGASHSKGGAYRKGGPYGGRGAIEDGKPQEASSPIDWNDPILERSVSQIEQVNPGGVKSQLGNNVA